MPTLVEEDASSSKEPTLVEEQLNLARTDLDRSRPLSPKSPTLVGMDPIFMDLTLVGEKQNNPPSQKGLYKLRLQPRLDELNIQICLVRKDTRGKSFSLRNRELHNSSDAYKEKHKKKKDER